MGTFPSPEWTITFESDKELLLVVWLGEGWLGGREGQLGAAENRLRTLTKKDLAELSKILGLAKK